MSPNKEILIKGIDGLYTANSLEDSLDKWNSVLTNYFNISLQSANPTFITSIKPLFDKSIQNKTFVDDFGTNILNWAKSIKWSNNKSLKLPVALDFKAFSENHKSDIDVNVYKNALVDIIHLWFSEITSFL